jgi:hypothetical protein
VGSGSGRYARGDKALGICERCSKKVLLKELRSDGYLRDLQVCPDCWDPYHPQERLPEVSDPVTLRDPTGDPDRAQASILEIPWPQWQPIKPLVGTPLAIRATLGSTRFGTTDVDNPTDPNAQSLLFERDSGAPVTISNGGLTMVGSTGNWWYACPGAAEDSDSSKLRASGGKWMYEVTIDSIPTTTAFCSIGFGNDTTAQFDTAVAGNGNGSALLVDDENGTLSRLYYGSSPSAFENASNPSFPLDAGGTVVTMGLDLDGGTVSAYMDGVLVHSRAYVLNGAEDDRIVPVVKSFNASVISLNTTVAYPIDGYTVWK